MNNYLGIELGSTRIKAITVDEQCTPVSFGEYTWASSYENGIWTYSLDEAFKGLRMALSGLEGTEKIICMGVSAMMHGYLAFDRDWNLLVPFRTWQNTITGEASEKLTALFGFPVPQRWSVAHLYQAMLNRESHVPQIAHITTLAGYVHYRLTGVNVVGVGDASGIFPIDSSTCDYDREMLDRFDRLCEEQPWKIRDLLPQVLAAGESAGSLTDEGVALLNDILKPGIPFAPPEGDAGTGMTATNAVTPGAGTVSGGTSVFAMVVLQKPLAHVHPEIDLLATPTGLPMAMVHCNNGTNDMNAWVSLLRETTDLFGCSGKTDSLYETLFEKSLEGEPDCGGLTIYNYLAGEGVTHLDAGRPLLVRQPDANFSLANFVRAQLYSSLTTLAIGMEILAGENVVIDRLMCHGGLFKTQGVGARYLAAACHVPVTCTETAGESGPYGMALLAAYCHYGSGTLEEFLGKKVFTNTACTTIDPIPEEEEGFRRYLDRFVAGLPVEKAALEFL